MRVTSSRKHSLEVNINRQIVLGRMFLYLTGCNITGVNNPVPATAYAKGSSGDPSDTSTHFTSEHTSPPGHTV
jgi:hypothetical protein